MVCQEDDECCFTTQWVLSSVKRPGGCVAFPTLAVCGLVNATGSNLERLLVNSRTVARPTDAISHGAPARARLAKVSLSQAGTVSLASIEAWDRLPRACELHGAWSG